MYTIPSSNLECKTRSRSSETPPWKRLSGSQARESHLTYATWEDDSDSPRGTCNLEALHPQCQRSRRSDKYRRASRVCGPLQPAVKCKSQERNYSFGYATFIANIKERGPESQSPTWMVCDSLMLTLGVSGGVFSVAKQFLSVALTEIRKVIDATI